MRQTQSSSFPTLLDRFDGALINTGLAPATVEPILVDMRSSLGDRENPFDLWSAIDEQIGKAKSPDVINKLKEFRAWFEDEMFVAVGSAVQAGFTQSPENGWQAWFGFLAEATIRFRLSFASRLFEIDGDFPDRARVAALRDGVRLMKQIRWPESYAQFLEMSNEPSLSPTTRARLFAILAQIHFFYFNNILAAKQCLEAAEKTDPSDGRVLETIAQFWAANKQDVAKADVYFKRAIEAAPKLVNPYCDWGEYFENEKEFARAEELYRTAIDRAPGESLGYSKLMRLYGRPEYATQHEEQWQPLMQKGIDVLPDDEYTLLVDLAANYEANRRFAEARTCYERAISIANDRPYAFVMMAQSFEKEALLDNANKERLLDEAKRIYQDLAKNIPDSFEGYGALGRLAQQRSLWEEALDCYQHVPRSVPQLAEIFDARIGEVYIQLGRHAEAEDLEKSLLRTNPNNENAKAVLFTIADDYYSQQKDRAKAKQLYDDMFEIVGESFTADYHNALGNLNYFFEDYDGAVNEYGQAIEHSPSAVFHRNLGVAFRQKGEYEKAEAKLQEAFEIDKDEDKLKKERSLILNLQANAQYSVANYQAAADLYTEAVDCDPENEIIQANLGGALENLREFDKARTAYEKAYERNPADKYAATINKLRAKARVLELYGEVVIDWQHVVTPVGVEVALNLVSLIADPVTNSLSPDLTRLLTEMRIRVEMNYGIKLPGVNFKDNPSDFGSGLYVFSLREIPAVSGVALADYFFFPGAKEDLKGLVVAGDDVINPATNAPGVWLTADEAKSARDAGHTVWNCLEYLMRQLEAFLTKNLADLIGHQEIADLIRSEIPKAIERLRSDRQKLTAFVTVCRALLAEGTPIKPLTDIYNLFESLYSRQTNPQSIAEACRSLPSLRPRLCGNQTEYSIVELTPRFEALIRRASYRSGSCPLLAIEPQACQDALSAVRNTVSNTDVIIVADPELRPLVRLLIEIEFPHIPVLSRSEVVLESKARAVIDFDGDVNAAQAQVFARQMEGVETGSGVQPNAMTTPSSPPQIVAFVSDQILGLSSAADDQALAQLRKAFFDELGLLTPEIRVQPDAKLNPNDLRLQINGRESLHEGLLPTQFLVNINTDRMAGYNIHGTAKLNPATSNQCVLVNESDRTRQSCDEAGLLTWGPIGYLALVLTAELRKQAEEFQTDDVTRYIVESARALYADLLEIVTERYSLPQLQALFSLLLDEGISIRDMRLVLEGLLSINGTTDVDLNKFIVFTPQGQNIFPAAGAPGIDNLTMQNRADAVRTFMKKYISYKYTRGVGTLMVLLINPSIERRFSDVARPITPSEITDFVEAVESEVKATPTATLQGACILTSLEVRRALRDAIKDKFPDLAVVSYQELAPETNIQPIARISLIEKTETAVVA